MRLDDENEQRLRAVVGDKAVDDFLRAAHRQRREQDEMACSCGKRWLIGEDHP